MLIWGILFAAFVLIEIAIPALISIWFAAAALILLFISPLIDGFLYEMLVFSILSLIFLISLRRVCRKYIVPEDRLRKEEVIINKETGSENGMYLYEVKYKGGIWSAKGEGGYMPGEVAFIKTFEGNKIILEKKL